MAQCTLCKARFSAKWMDGTQCKQCVQKHGPDVDREKVLKESNPEVHPQHEYVQKHVFEELVARLVKLEEAYVAAGAKVEEVPPKRKPGRPALNRGADNAK